MHGKILDESSSVYHSNEAVSHSKLEVFRRRPAMFHKRFIAKSVIQEHKDVFTFGQAFHMAILEPSEFPLRYAYRPEGLDRRTKDGKAAYEAFIASNEGKTVLEMEDGRTIERMREAISGHQIAAKLLAKGEPEVSWRVPDQRAPAGVQCRTDWVNVKDGYIVDLKSVDNLDGDLWLKAVLNWGYHRQAAFYTSILSKCGESDMQFYFVAVEKREPYGVVIYRMSGEAMTVGYKENEADLDKLANCYAKNNWPNLSTEVVNFELPAWYKGGAL